MNSSIHDSVRLSKKETERLHLRTQLHNVCAKVHDNEECKKTVSNILNHNGNGRSRTANHIKASIEISEGLSESS